jgi:hypothetical protein
MNIFFWVLAAIVLVFVIFQGRMVIPRVISFLFPGSRRVFFDDSGAPISEKHRELVRPVLEKIEALGFSQLGFMTDKPPLWAKGSREIVLASSTERTFVSIGLRKNRLSYFFYTPFTGDQIVITAYNAFRDVHLDGFVTAVVYTEDIEGMLEVHREQLQEFIRQGFEPYREYNRESIVKATYSYYESPFPRQRLRVAGMINLFVYLVFILVLALLIWGAVG